MVPRRSQRYPAEKISDFDFADDIVQVTGRFLRKTPMSIWIARADSQVDLHINTTKRKLISDLRRRLDSFQTSVLKIILRVSRRDLFRNEDRTGTVPLFQSVKAHQIRFLGHSLRRPQGDLIFYYALRHPTHGKPVPGPGRKVLFHEYATKLINPENPSFLRLTKYEHWHKIARHMEAHGGRIPHECLKERSDIHLMNSSYKA